MNTKRKNPNKKGGWDKNCGIYRCSDGQHKSFWQTIVQSKEWGEWYKYQMKNQTYDIDESQECGWLGKEHWNDFVKFIISQNKLKIAFKGKIK